MTPHPRLSVIILAAGASQRLGQPKQLVQYKGQSLIARAIQSAESLSPHEILVITGADVKAVQAEVEHTNARCVYNPGWSNGMGTSIATGAQSIDDKSQGLMVLLCDQWRILPEDLKLLVEEWCSVPNRIICSATENRCGPPVIFPASCLAELGVLTGDHGAHSIIDRHRDSVSRVSMKNAAFDLDTPSQLKGLSEYEKLKTVA